MPQLNLKPTQKPVRTYYQALERYGQLSIDHEMAVRSAFHDLLAYCCRQFKWTLIPEWPISRRNAPAVRVDAAIVDDFRLRRGLWEAKDEHDDLESEARQKIALGYPTDNIVFQSPNRAILWQRGTQVLDEDISRPENLVEVLRQFFEYREPHHEKWEEAVSEFSFRLPEIARALKETIDEERKNNPEFVRSFESFFAHCQHAINPNLPEEAVERMLIQHLLTERIFRKVFNNPDFTRRNVIAMEIENVIATLTRRSFNRDEFLRRLDRFYKAIELSAEQITEYSEKQAFLNTLYERFFQGYSPKEADTHGIVYTPQPIVDFIVKSVERILAKEFERTLSDRGVHILDPFVGTGNFIVRIMKETKASALPHKFAHELHCNEIMLLPYYIATMNIEHEYVERAGEYQSFPGVCLVDTFELAEPEQPSLGFISEENVARVVRQKKAPIFVVIGNPPWNANQMNENDNNKNRRYPGMDERVARTYRQSSVATLTNKLNDPYVKAIRWASDRIGEAGVVAYVTNNSFMDAESFDGMRKELAEDFSSIYLINLKGNARTAGERRKREAGNVFDDQIRVGVGISFFIRKQRESPTRAKLFKYSVEDHVTSGQKKELLNKFGSYAEIPFQQVTIGPRNTWSLGEVPVEFSTFLPLCAKQSYEGSAQSGHIFSDFFLGVSTNRDDVVYDHNRAVLLQRVRGFIDKYNQEVNRFQYSGKKNLQGFALDPEIKWSESLKNKLLGRTGAQFDDSCVRVALRRPFSRMLIYLGSPMVDRPGRFKHYLPTPEVEAENIVLCCSAVADKRAFSCLCTNVIPDLHLAGDTQCFPLYLYGQNGTGRRENITDWALEQFRTHYSDPTISKLDILHYVYAVLHHHSYRERYGANLATGLPRIPFASAFRPLAEAGAHLVRLHLDYEKQKGFPLERAESPNEKLDWRVSRMALKREKSALVYNRFLTLRGIPPATYEYRLGHQSALEWVIEQHQVTTNKRSGIVWDPNRPDGPEYLVRLIEQVIAVSLETVRIIQSLPPLHQTNQN